MRPLTPATTSFPDPGFVCCLRWVLLGFDLIHIRPQLDSFLPGDWALHTCSNDMVVIVGSLDQEVVHFENLLTSWVLEVDLVDELDHLAVTTADADVDHMMETVVDLLVGALIYGHLCSCHVPM